MTYEIYREEREFEEYFKAWDGNSLNSLTDELKRQIHKKYLMKCKVLNRDKFTCQNQDCVNKLSPLTLHHIKFQKNNGDNKARNCVTLCKSCHMAYHKCKREITFGDSKSLPVHIRGHTFKLKRVERFNWKQIKVDMRILRKNLKVHHGIILSAKQISLLMKVLTIPYDEWDD